MIGHLPRIFDLAGALLTSCASVSFAASSDVFTAEVLVIRLEAVYGVAHPALAGTLENLAILFESEQRDDLAEPRFRQALKAFERAPQAMHLGLARCLERYARLLRRTGRLGQLKLHAVQPARPGATRPAASRRRLCLTQVYCRPSAQANSLCKLPPAHAGPRPRISGLARLSGKIS